MYESLGSGFISRSTAFPNRQPSSDILENNHLIPVRNAVANATAQCRDALGIV
jgi:hypothetical protein